jgi:HAD superfamily hydrolase (TIGR01549 family)
VNISQIEKISIIKKAILSHDIISFDIFDTLISRPYTKPNHLFYHMEQCLNLDGFAEARMNAERLARKNKIHEDITFEDIWKLMPQKFRQAQELELNFEEKLLKRNDDIYNLYKFACDNNKKIAFISDMYLPKEFLVKVLAKNGFSDFDFFYLSGEKGYVKHTGNLFKKFLSEEKINPKNMLHIGDHKKSDKKIPTKLGIDCFNISTKLNRFMESNKCYKFKNLIKNNKKSLSISIILSLLSEKYTDTPISSKNVQDYFYNLGYCFGGAVGYGFSKYILEKTEQENASNLLFIARDGYILEQIVKILSPKPLNTFYVYAQRALKEKFNLDNNSNQNAEEAINDYKEYLRSLGIDFNEKIAILDSGASTFSAQRILEKVIGKKLLGIYTIITSPKNKVAYDINCKTWANNKNDFLYITSLIELLFTSKEFPICDIKGNKPIYLEPTKEEILRCELYPFISLGILDFINDIKNRLGDLLISFQAPDVNEYVKYFDINLTPIDKEMLNSIYYASDTTHNRYKHTVFRLICKLTKHPKYWGYRYNAKVKSMIEDAFLKLQKLSIRTSND